MFSGKVTQFAISPSALSCQPAVFIFVVTKGWGLSVALWSKNTVCENQVYLRVSKKSIHLRVVGLIPMFSE